MGLFNSAEQLQMGFLLTLGHLGRWRKHHRIYFPFMFKVVPDGFRKKCFRLELSAILFGALYDPFQETGIWYRMTVVDIPRIYPRCTPFRVLQIIENTVLEGALVLKDLANKAEQRYVARSNLLPDPKVASNGGGI